MEEDSTVVEIGKQEPRDAGLDMDDGTAMSQADVDGKESTSSL